MLNYYLLETSCFANAADNFIRVTRLRDRGLTAPNITTQLNYVVKKCVNIHCEEKTGNLTYMLKLFSNKPPLRKKNNVKSLQWTKAHKDWTIELWNRLMNQSSKSFGRIGESISGKALMIELHVPVSHQP